MSMQLRVQAVRLAKALKWPLEEIPQAFALNELEDYVARAKSELLKQRSEIRAK